MSDNQKSSGKNSATRSFIILLGLPFVAFALILSFKVIGLVWEGIEKGAQKSHDTFGILHTMTPLATPGTIIYFSQNVESGEKIARSTLEVRKVREDEITSQCMPNVEIALDRKLNRSVSKGDILTKHEIGLLDVDSLSNLNTSFDNKNYSEAKQSLTKSIPFLERQLAELLLCRAKCLKKLGKSKKADLDRERALKLYPAYKSIK